ncbi:MAG: bifunctional oligoribonuclease/PAP phosphatase NrnA [Pseudobdellovibrionaceae bacterium]|nr:bifunctional oligoribonuclease/PAP phosphatase NrnA [Bdellovibrionales bacterium]USN48545.1 MAG: bifunctional oligoribonuclease/PAP phosphatase NrnA [Pseudobdellovibrionaceae bacterium]
MDSRYLKNLELRRLVEKIETASSILLTTHKQCDGDGLGAMLGLYHALRKLDKKVRVITVDGVPAKYRFLQPELHLQNFDKPHDPIEPTDLCLIFDTNDRRLVDPLFFELEKQCKQIAFVDHHPVLNKGPEPTPGSYIDTSAASTGEIAFFIIKALGIRMDQMIARALYTSIAFDTQIFRYVKNSPSSHLIAAELLEHEKNAYSVHRFLFATYTQEKIAFLGKVLSEVEYFAEGQVAVVKVSLSDLKDHDLDMDDSRDVIDMIMNINALQVAALFREDAPNEYKLSLRSKGSIEVLGIAESFGGGGHMFASGAPLQGQYEDLKLKLVNQFLKRLNGTTKAKS